MDKQKRISAAFDEPLEDKKKSNSVEFDKASFEADGGVGQYDERRKHIFDNPMHADQALWSKAKEMSSKTYGKQVWQFVLWAYRKLGGKV